LQYNGSMLFHIPQVPISNLRWMLAFLTDLCVFFLILLKHIPGNSLKQAMTCSSDIHPK